MATVDVAWATQERRDAAPTEVCDYCQLPVSEDESRTEVGHAVYHREPNCYLRKLRAIDRH